MLQLVDVEEGIDNSDTTLRAFLNSVDSLHGADSFAAYAPVGSQPTHTPASGHRAASLRHCAV